MNNLEIVFTSGLLLVVVALVFNSKKNNLSEKEDLVLKSPVRNPEPTSVSRLDRKHKRLTTINIYNKNF